MEEDKGSKSQAIIDEQTEFQVWQTMYLKKYGEKRDGEKKKDPRELLKKWISKTLYSRKEVEGGYQHHSLSGRYGFFGSTVSSAKVCAHNECKKALDAAGVNLNDVTIIGFCSPQCKVAYLECMYVKV